MTDEALNYSSAIDIIKIVEPPSFLHYIIQEKAQEIFYKNHGQYRKENDDWKDWFLAQENIAENICKHERTLKEVWPLAEDIIYNGKNKKTNFFEISLDENEKNICLDISYNKTRTKTKIPLHLIMAYGEIKSKL